MQITKETENIVKKFIQDLEASIQIGVDENISPNDFNYDQLKEQAFNDGTGYAVEMLFRLQQEHCD